ncbi:glycosyltransferase [Flavihumibacter sp. ZG627]|uniref:glycosyltransferase family 2 protein n=1 Tax=Flavihumibacter sp. ZG627 TaxID=1463156 RepID=UPI00057F1625|nr:glycosyltransferase [Flavihumibacter sp. ZG627]KIC92324.1 hypothetical protein HY58_01950 [Flavihumibacter sp. ZG627]
MNDRIPESPPVITPVPTGTIRPLWSVMIPAYNCMEFLKQAIASVLEQAPAEDIMQIEVVDDASTDGNIKELVETIGKGRVSYFRQPENVGSLRNFETCLNRSRGHLIHLLHGDDLVSPGFYQEMGSVMEKFPEAGSAFCSYSFINKDSQVTSLASPIMDKAGIIEDWLEKVAVINYPQPPSVVVRRSVYEHLGGFFAAHYGEDWEMWCRIAANYPVAYTPKCLAKYRIHFNNISTKALLSGQSVADINKLIGIIQQYLPLNKRKKIRNKSKHNFSTHFASIALRNFYGDKDKYLKLAYKSFLMDRNRTTFYFLTKIVLSYFVQVNTTHNKS